MIKKRDLLRAKYDTASQIVEVEFDEYVDAYKNIYNFTVSSKYHSFQYRMLQNIIFLNGRLHLMKLVDSNKCTFCKEVKETVKHIFWECPDIVKYWADMADYVREQFGTEVVLTWSKIMLDNIMNPVIDCINCVILVAKQIIFRSQCVEKKTKCT